MSVLTKFGDAKWVCVCVQLMPPSPIPPNLFSLASLQTSQMTVAWKEAKDLVVLVRFFDTTVMRAVTHFLYLPTANDGTAAAIFEKIDQILMFRGIKYENFLCFNSDSCWGTSLRFRLLRDITHSHHLFKHDKLNLCRRPPSVGSA